MISNIAPKSTEVAGNAGSAAGDSADSGDTGAFDALLAMVGEATVTDLGAQLAGELEGVELPGALDDSDDSASDDDASPDDALSFLAAILPLVPKPVPVAVSAGDAAASSVQGDASAMAGGAMASSVNSNATTDDLAQAILLGMDTGTEASKAAATFATTSNTPTPDTPSLTALTGPAEMFAHAHRQGVERAESSPLTTHVRDPRWADDLGNRLASMVRTGESSASLQLTPVDLGPLEVKVAVRDNQASVHFGATNADTRALLEASIPRLREMLAAQGFQLMDSSVSHGFARPTRHESAGTPRVDEVGESPSVVTQTHISGLLDLYA
jgi:flagellar hook-length control protein FliK